MNNKHLEFKQADFTTLVAKCASALSYKSLVEINEIVSKAKRRGRPEAVMEEVRLILRELTK